MVKALKALMILLVSPLMSSSWSKKDEWGLGRSDGTRSACSGWSEAGGTTAPQQRVWEGEQQGQKSNLSKWH